MRDYMTNKIISFFILCFLSTNLLADTNKSLKDIAPYPEPLNDQKRYILFT